MKIDQVLNPVFVFKNRKRILPYIEKRRNYWKLSKLKDRHRGDRCFIIGNGPSLSLQDLARLKNEVTFAANKIYLVFDQTEWRPTYFVLEDDHVILQHHLEICRLKGFTKLVKNQWKHLFRYDRNAIFYPWRYLEAQDFPKFSENSLRVSYCGHMVTYISLQLAYFMGFTRVYLIGVDFNYSLVYQGQHTIEHSSQHTQDHFIRDYFKPGETRYLPVLDRAEQAMVCAKKVYEAHGRKVFNATRGGKLEIFDRIALEEVLEY
jgi:hypothetical protein